MRTMPFRCHQRMHQERREVNVLEASGNEMEGSRTEPSEWSSLKKRRLPQIDHGCVTIISFLPMFINLPLYLCLCLPWRPNVCRCREKGCVLHAHIANSVAAIHDE